MDIKVGDKVRYTGPSEYDLTHGKVYGVVWAGFSIIDVLDDEGDRNSFWCTECELVTDTPQTPTIKPEPKLEFFGISVDKFSTDDLQKLASDVAKELHRRFRMIEADVEPKKPREVWIVDGAHVYTDKSVALQDMADFQSNDIALFRKVLDE